MDNSSKYLEQFDRVKRWYQRFVIINEGRQHNLPSDNYQDEVYAFFLNCYHLKDWIKNDESVGAAAKDKVEEFINNNKELSLCADICNSIKHLKLDENKKPRSGQDPRFGQRNFHLQVGGPETTISVRYTIDTSSGPVDAFELATKCLKAWETFIQSNINIEQK
jgi:hypothetical protein